MWPFRARRVTRPEITEFVVIAETGVLERQALLLCESLRLFGGRHARSQIHIVSPRADRRPAASSLAAFARMGCAYLPLDVASVEPAYGTTFRMYASAAVEAATGAAALVVLDSDILVAQEPDFSLDGAAAAVRPVDVKGMCSEGPRDPADAYWRALATCCGATIDSLPMLRTTVDKLTVRASHNGGVVAVVPSAGIFRRALEHFEQSVRHGVIPSPGTGHVVHASHAMVAGRGAEYWGSAQACLSLAIWGHGLQARTLPLSHNFPLHSFYSLTADERATPLTLIHYHRMFEDRVVPNPLLNGDAMLSPDFRDWIAGKAARLG